MTLAYEIRIKDTTGSNVVILDDKGGFQSLAYSHLINGKGIFMVEMNADDPRVDLFDLDYQVEIWRSNRALDLPPYLEFEGLQRTPTETTTQDRANRFRLHGFSYAELLQRRETLYFAGEPQTKKSGVGETVMKEYVDENIGPAALASNGRFRDGNMTGFSVQADAAGGASWSGSRTYKNLLGVLQDVAPIAGLDFDVVGNGTALFQFRTYSPQRGTDRSTVGLVPATGLNAVGEVPVIFSVENMTMAEAVYSKVRNSEVNIAIAMGRGEGAGRDFEIREDIPLQGDSPWNERERTVNASNEPTDDVNALRVRADKLLDEGKPRERITFEAVQQPHQYYGQHYFWGDIVQARFAGVDVPLKITAVDIVVEAKDRTSETLNFTFKEV